MKTTPLTEKEITYAFRQWCIENKRYILDEELQLFLAAEIQAFRLPTTSDVQASTASKGWLKKSRQALLLSTRTVAQKMSTSQQTYLRLESSEKKGTITLNSLARAAEALDCELVYAIRPRERISFSQRVWWPIFQKAKDHPWLSRCDQKKRGAALAAIVRMRFSDCKFRSSQGWVRRRRLDLA